MKNGFFLLLMGLLLIASCGSCKKENARQPDETYNPVVLPENFSAPTNLTNTYFPAPIGKKYVYEAQTEDGLVRIEEQRLPNTRQVLGIECVVVNFKEWVNGTLVENANDWYAQDNNGNVWYMGEEVDNFNSSGTIVNHNGSWEAGVDGAKPGLIMPVTAQVGMAYRQEYYFGEAEDEAEVIAVGLTVSTPYGTFDNCIKTREWTALEPDVNEFKFFAPGIGLVKVIDVNTNEEENLTAIED